MNTLEAIQTLPTFHAKVLTEGKYCIFEGYGTTVVDFVNKCEKLGKMIIGDVNMGKYNPHSYHG